MWVPPEIKDPILRHAPTRKSVACFGAVSLDTGQFVRMMCPIFNAATFRTFLGRLLRQQTPGRRMIVVLDTARYHQARLLADFLHRKAQQQLRLLFLPPYSPQLAPIERVWKLTRRLATHNRYFATLAEVLKAVSACFDRWRKPNKVLHRLCCIT
jgi:transposase